MKKKILCVAMSMIMAVGVLTGCGGKAKSTILTEINPWESKAEDVEAYLKDHNLTYEVSEYLGAGNPKETTTTDKFLDYEATYDFTYADKDEDLVAYYSVVITFKDKDEYDKGVDEIRSYIESIAEKVEKDSTESTESAEQSDFYEIKNNAGETHELEFKLKSYDEPPAGYYNTVVKLFYGEEIYK